jgi:hypothetical protein
MQAGTRAHYTSRHLHTTLGDVTSTEFEKSAWQGVSRA